MSFLDEPEHIASVKLYLAPPGEFAGVFPSAVEDDVIGLIANGFSRARLDGFFPTHTYDADTYEVTPDLSDAGLALVFCYTSMLALKPKLLALSATSNTRYKAGPVETETSSSGLATVLRALLEESIQTIKDLKFSGSKRVRPRFGDLAHMPLVRSYVGELLDVEMTSVPRF
jgi:hypothetical protein